MNPSRSGNEVALTSSATSSELPWHEYLGQELQRGCRDITRSIDHLRHNLQGRQPERQQRQLDSASIFLNPHVPYYSQLSSRGTPSAAPGAVTLEEVGRATWLFLHTLAAQYPERPTRQQQRDARALMDVLTRMYPCGECARHFSEVVMANPPAVASRHDFSQWMCRVHNVVNRSLGKPTFNCDLVEARWAGLECGDQDACTLDVGRQRRR